MQYRHLFPMVRILLPFMAGIVVCIGFSATIPIPLLIWLSLLILSFAAGIFPSGNWRFVKQWLFGILVSLALFVTGFNSVLLHKEILRPTHFSKAQTQGSFIACIAEPLQEKEHSFKTILEVKGVINDHAVSKAEGHILAYFAKDPVHIPPAEGSTIVFTGTIQQISPPQNPGAFDYRKYMATNNVYHQVYLNPISWKTLAVATGFNLKRAAHQISMKFVKTLSNNGLKGQEFAVASALILGQNDMLDNETRQAYSGSGVTHILSVSGLHVGVIYIIINFVLGFMKKGGIQLYFKTGLILVTIWAYALLTGMSPPVMRSAAMFTFISIGNASKRYVHIINSLAVSALLLLLVDPLMISNIGFQLSYLAIVGIVFINKPIADLFNPSNKIADQVWSLIAVSLAAQLATAPLTMLYFHQFPAYFIPANLIAIPLSFLAIYAGVAVLATSAIPVISNFAGMVTNLLLFAMNYSVGFIEKLPYSVLRITSIFNMEMILLYLILISTLLLIYFRKKTFLYLALGMTLAFSASITFSEIGRQRQQKIIFYSSGKQSAIGFVNGRNQQLVADTMLVNNKTAYKFQFEGTKSMLGIRDDEVYSPGITGKTNDRPLLFSQGPFFMFHNKRIALIDSIPKPYAGCAKLKVDYLVIRHNAKLRINDLQKMYQPGLIIVDGSNSYYRTNKWLAECRKAGLKVYSIKNRGAYVVDL